MKLITIGTSKNATIKLNSSFVSSNHAEIILLDNGDIILVDKDSKNGTFIQNQRIEPNKEIVVRRGDNIRFADVYLDWNSIPTLPPIDYSKVKGVYGIGSNHRNKYCLMGNTVSRFHATLTEMKSGKWFIRDHSTNGTTLNGVKLMSGKDYPIKHKDIIVCGGVQLNNPVPGNNYGFILKLSAAAVIVALLAVFAHNLIVPDLHEISTASALVYGEYHYVIELEDDPFVGIPDWPKKYYCVIDENDEIQISDDLKDIDDMVCTGTAFFVSDDGRMVTNRHVACPWHEYQIDAKLRDKIMHEMTIFKSSVLKELSYILPDNIDNDAYRLRFQTSRIKISGEYSYIGVGVSGRKYNSFLELEPCTILKQSDDKDIDVAILQLNSGVLPATVKYKYDLEECIMDPKKLKIQKDEYMIIGYNGGIRLNLDNQKGGLKPSLSKAYISKQPDEFVFQLQGEAIGGSSGSPICTRKGKLIGILYAKSNFITTESYGIHAKYAKEMNDKIY